MWKEQEICKPSDYNQYKYSLRRGNMYPQYPSRAQENVDDWEIISWVDPGQFYIRRWNIINQGILKMLNDIEKTHPEVHPLIEEEIFRGAAILVENSGKLHRATIVQKHPCIIVWLGDIGVMMEIRQRKCFTVPEQWKAMPFLSIPAWLKGVKQQDEWDDDINEKIYQNINGKNYIIETKKEKNKWGISVKIELQEGGYLTDKIIRNGWGEKSETEDGFTGETSVFLWGDQTWMESKLRRCRQLQQDQEEALTEEASHDTRETMQTDEEVQQILEETAQDVENDDYADRDDNDDHGDDDDVGDDEDDNGEMSATYSNNIIYQNYLRRRRQEEWDGGSDGQKTDNEDETFDVNF